MSAVAPRVKTRHRGVYYRVDSKNHRRYIVWYADSNGKGRTETLPLGSSEQDALNRQAELRGRMAKGERVVPSKLRLGDWIDGWLETQRKKRDAGDLAENTIRSYLSNVNHLKGLRRLRLTEIGRGHLVDLIVDMRAKGYKAWTIKRVLSTLSVMLDDAIVANHLTVNVTKSLTRRERPKGDQRAMRCLDRDEIGTLFSVVPKYYADLIRLLVFTGLRISEALNLRWEDVDFEGELLTVTRSKTEAGTGREVTLFPALVEVLRARHVSELVRGYGRPSDFVFASKVGTMMHRGNTLKGALRKESVTEALGHLTQHELRHTFASILIGEGFDVTYVAAQLGHKDPSITLRTYAKLFDPKRRRQEAREKLQASFSTVLA